MIFNSFGFLSLFPIIFIIYYLTPAFMSKICKGENNFTKVGNGLLVIISYSLYAKWKPVYALVLMWVTFVTYASALLIEKRRSYGNKKYIFLIGIVLSSLPLFLFKYYDFVSAQLETFIGYFGISVGISGLNWAMPLGISFFTLQAVGYLADVYLKRVNAEHGWWNYVLFVSFFPQIASGPISKAKDLLPQIKSNRRFNYAQAVQGCKWILWGMFMKVVVADSLGMHVDLAYQGWASQTGSNLLLMSFLYTFQIYCDFAGYSFVAVGVGELLGFELINNFRRPYFSQSVTDFWHRWHISLSTWLKDYIYIPLGGNRCSQLRNYINIFFTFVVSGMWHGANWTFMVWGMLHGLFQVIEKELRLNKLSSQGPVKAIRIVITFTIINFLWIFFRMPSLKDACGVITKILSCPFGSVEKPFWALFLIGVVLFKDIVDERGIKWLNLLHHRYAIVRWFAYFLLLSMLSISGVYGGQFIYSGF